MMAEKGPIFLAEERSISNDVVENASGKTPIAASIREVDGLVVLGMDQDDMNFYEKFTPQMRLRLNRKVRSVIFLTHQLKPSPYEQTDHLPRDDVCD